VYISAAQKPVPIFATWRPNNENLVSKIIWIALDGAFQVADGNQLEFAQSSFNCLARDHGVWFQRLRPSRRGR
jgi:hypothetical protein